MIDLQALESYFVISKIFRDFDSAGNILLEQNLKYRVTDRDYERLKDLFKITLTLIEICCQEDVRKIRHRESTYLLFSLSQVDT